MQVINIITKNGTRLITLADDNRRKVPEVEKFLQFLYRTNHSPNTITTYCYSLKTFYEFLELKDMTYDDVVQQNDEYGPIDFFQDFILYLQYPDYYRGIISFMGEKPAITNRSVNCILAAVCSYYDYLARNKNLTNLDVYRDIMGNNHFKSFLHGMHLKKVKSLKNVLKLKEHKERIKYLTTEQFEKVFNAATNTRDKCILAVGFYGGLRIGEILNLRISDIEFWNLKINIVPRENNINKSRVKNYAAGCVFVPNEVMLMLVKYLDEVKKYNCDYLFVNLAGNEKGMPMNADNVEVIFDRLSKKVGFKVTPHMLRHSFAVHRISSSTNYSLVALQHDMRHKNVETTMIYAEFFNETQMEYARQYFEQIGKDFSPSNLNFYDDIGGGLI